MELVTREMIGQLTPGMKIKYQSKTNSFSEATYEGEILEVYKHHILVKVAPMKETMEENLSVFGDETGEIKRCINKAAIGVERNGDRLFVA